MDNLTKEIVVSSRVRLARNFDKYNFPIRLSNDADAKQIQREVFSVVNFGNNFMLYSLKNMDNNQILKFLERHLISRELIENKDIAGFCINKNEDKVIMINEEDHIREQCIKKGFVLELAYDELQDIDDNILEKCDIAYSQEFGFLTACPSNIGTGMRASCMMFLPALTKTGAIENIIQTFSKLGFAVRGFLGEGSEAEGYLYQISNQQTLGLSEEDILKSVKNAVLKVCEMENEAREVLFQTKQDQIKDATYRAYGILANSYRMPEKEFTKLISDLKLGFALGLIDFRNPNILEEIEVSSRPANLDARFGEELDDDKRDKFRADYLCRALKNQRI